MRAVTRTSSRAGRNPAIVALGMLLVLTLAPAARAADESLLLDHPPARSVEDEKGPLERAFEEPPPQEPVEKGALAQKIDDWPSFFRDTQLDVDFRTYYFRRRFPDNRDAEALAMGGALQYRSGWLLDRLQIGATLFGSQKLYGPSDRDGTGLLRPGQRSYIVVGESFVRYREWGNELTAYRHRLDLPFLNGNDSRMTPNTFEGVSLIGYHERIGYSIGHLLQIKRRNDDGFVSFSEAAGVAGASSNGLSFAGVSIEPIEGLSLGAINHFVKDTLNTAYTEVEWYHGDPKGLQVRLGTQFTHQRSVGDDRLTGESFETWIWDGKVAVSWKQALFSVAVAITDDEERIRNPWGSFPGYLAMMTRNFNNAGEKAWGVGASCYLGVLGLSDFSVALRYSEGYDGRIAATGQKIGDQREVNATLDYRVSRGLLQGLWLRGRFAWAEIEDARRDELEGRIVLRYEFRAL